MPGPYSVVDFSCLIIPQTGLQYNAILKDGDLAEALLLVLDVASGKQTCAERCRQKAIQIVDGRAQIDDEKCVFCGYCARVCPQFCIKVV